MPAGAKRAYASRGPRERRGEVPGIHTVVRDSPVDSITLSHSAKSREGFALGAVMAAEWLQGRKGFFTVDDMMSGNHRMSLIISNVLNHLYRITKSFKDRLSGSKTTRWIRFAAVSLLFFLFVSMDPRQPVALLVWPLLADIYITGYIPFTWWKKSKSRPTRVVMGWVDAIVYALVAPST